MGYKSKSNSGAETKGAVRKPAAAQTKAGRNSGGNWTGKRNLLWTTEAPGVSYSRLTRQMGAGLRPDMR